MASDRVFVWPELSVQADADDEPVLLTVRVIWEGSLLLWQRRELIHCLLQRRGSIRSGHWFRRGVAQFCSAYDLVFGGVPPILPVTRLVPPNAGDLALLKLRQSPASKSM